MGSKTPKYTYTLENAKAAMLKQAVKASQPKRSCLNVVDLHISHAIFTSKPNTADRVRAPAVDPR